MWGCAGCNEAGWYITFSWVIYRWNRAKWEGGRKLKGGAVVTAATPHHGNSCLVMLLDWPIGTLPSWILYQHLSPDGVGLKKACIWKEGTISKWQRYYEDPSVEFVWHYQWITFYFRGCFFYTMRLWENGNLQTFILNLSQHRHVQWAVTNWIHNCVDLMVRGAKTKRPCHICCYYGRNK